MLKIEFINRAIYRYLNVPPLTYYDLMSADSKTRYYDLNIKQKYCALRVRLHVKHRPSN
jgi:KTSC domain